ncbi:MAG: YidC/Oxa1 family membrane protein insertase [Eubacteriales bacterium]
MNIMDFIYVPFGYAIRFFSQISGGNYALALLLFAIAVKIVLFPLSIKQQKSQVKGALLRPKIALIEKKYKGRNDEVTLKKKRQELMDLQTKEGYSPLAGCLPLLLQMPIILALYRIIRHPLIYISRFSEKTVALLYNKAVELGLMEGTALQVSEDVAFKAIKNIDQIKLTSAIQANSSSFAGMAEDFSQLPSFTLFGLDFAQTPNFSSLLILVPVFVLLTSWLSMKLSKKLSGNLQAELSGQTEDQQKSGQIMETMMPLMSLVFSFMLTAALGLYWIYQSVLQMGQMYLLNLIWPIPKMTDEQVKEFQREVKEVQREAPTERPRSLHHIDDDDDDLPPSPRKTTPPPKKKQAPGIQKAPLKNEPLKDESLNNEPLKNESLNNEPSEDSEDQATDK